LAANDVVPLATRLIGRRSTAELKRLRLVLSAAAGCLDEQWCAWSTRLRGQAVGHYVFRLEVSFLDVLLPDTSFRMNEAHWSEWPLFIPVTCCPACSAIGWLAELVGMARWM
jgi:hypothetical protein